MKPKQLRKISNGRLFAYTDALAELPGMAPVWAPGEEPEPEEQVSKGLEVNTKDIDSKVKKMMRSKDKMLVTMEKQLLALSEENQKLLDQVADLENLLAGVSLTEGQAVENELATEPLDDLATNERMDILVGKTLEMMEKADPNDFTDANMPRVERLEVWAGIAEVTAKERTEAFKKAQELRV
jgi:hypothetical protein